MAEKQQTVWAIADVIDFEVLVREDEDGDAFARKKLSHRDRSIYLEIKSENPREENLTSKRFLFRKWLDHRRKALYQRSDSPGQEIHSLLKFLSIWLGLLGWLIAFGIVQGFFSGSLGREGEANPVPVVAMVVVCVIVPFLLTLYGFWVALGNRLPLELPTFPPVLQGFWIRLVNPLFCAIGRKFSEHSSNESRLRANAFAGDLRSIATSRRGIVAAYFLLWMQCLSLGYSVGLPLSIAWKNSTTSRDYGWSTNYNETITPERVTAFARVLALPWSGWMGAGEGYPSLEQVRASQHERYDPATSENSEVWGVWATFLLFASVFYVSVPRVALFFLSRANLRKALNTEPFEEKFSGLYERLTKPRGDFEPSKKSEEQQGGQDADLPSELPPFGASDDERSCVMAMAVDLFSDAFQSAIAGFLKKENKWSVSSSVTVPEDASGRQEFAENLPEMMNKSGSLRLVIVEDVLSPPARQQMNYLKTLRRELGSEPGIVVALFSDDGEATTGGGLPETHYAVWHQKLKALGDPNLRLINLGSFDCQKGPTDLPMHDPPSIAEKSSPHPEESAPPSPPVGTSSLSYQRVLLLRLLRDYCILPPAAETPPPEEAQARKRRAEKRPAGKKSSRPAENSSPPATASSSPIDANACVVIMSEDLVSAAFQAAVEGFLVKTKKWRVSSSKSVPQDAAGRRQFVDELPALLDEGGSSTLVIVEDVFTPATREQLNYIREIRQKLVRQQGIVVALFADDEGDGSSLLGGELPEVEFEVWRQKLKILGDPNLRVVSFHSSNP